ncbi:MAG: MFS transporter [Rhizomicrobium sp.]
MANVAAVDVEAPAGGILKRHIAAACAGNALEFYDFIVYTTFAGQIGHALFPGRTEFEKLMLSLAGFGIGFLSRPLGGYVIGRYGDRAGRRPAMLLAFMLMGASILGMALVPSYAAIGIAAPLLAVTFRLVQGFALGGNVGPTTAYLIEAARPEQRGFYCSLQFASQGLAVFVGGLAGTILSNLLDAQSLASWGWRVAFLLGAVVLPFGFYIRNQLPETFESRAPDVASPSTNPGDHARIIVLGFLMAGSATIAIYTLTNMTTYASSTLHMAANVSFAATAIVGLGNMVFAAAGGALSDIYGRRPLSIWPRVVLALVTLPLFFMLDANRTAVWLLAATLVMTALNGLSTAAAFASLTEGLPKESRAGVFGVVYALAISIFGGTTQPIETWLSHVTANPLVPAWYLTAATILGVIALALTRETAPAIADRARSARPARPG